MQDKAPLMTAQQDTGYECSGMSLGVIFIATFQNIWFYSMSLGSVFPGSWSPKQCQAWIPSLAVVLKSIKILVS